MAWRTGEAVGLGGSLARWCLSHRTAVAGAPRWIQLQALVQRQATCTIDDVSLVKETLVRVPDADAGWTLVDRGIPATVAPSTTPPDPPAVSRYERHATLGEGGMGVIHLVSDRRIGREVAMKTMRPERALYASFVDRFVREACVQGQLEHPAIVPVYDLGVDALHAPFFTMKRVHGATFAEIITRLRDGDAEALGRYGRRKLLTAFASVCQAIDFAHTRGVIHRDLKPSNVMMGDFGEVYVLDWGVAKITTGAEIEPHGSMTPPAGTETHTLAGVAMGTPGYMSPEQLVAARDVDGRTDVYALGVQPGRHGAPRARRHLRASHGARSHRALRERARHAHRSRGLPGRRQRPGKAA
jgi:hypothetical protein